MNHRFLNVWVGAIICALVLQFPSAATARGPEKVLYAFGSHPDGRAPSSMIDVDGVFYGTTNFGGGVCKGFGCGTVFEVDPATGAETVLYSFCEKNRKKICDDGDVPGGLVAVKGKLYGETELGGAYHAGTVFSFDLKTHKEKIVHSFCAQDCTDGSYPDGGLTEVNGILYGTTPFGGANDKGTIFSLDPKTGEEIVLYSFCSQQGCADGDLPSGGLLNVNGTLYGATGRAGANCADVNSMECGTLYALDLNTGAETTLYSFCGQPNCADGNGPHGLVYLDGIVYGATGTGGAFHDAGTVFAFDPVSGTERVVYSFCLTFKTVCEDGAHPGRLIVVNGKLYGTGSGGNAVVVCPEDGCGSVFEVDPATGAESVLYAFCSQKFCNDGTVPDGMLNMNGTFYGTTSEGGHYDAHHCDFGCGVVFSLKQRTGNP